MNVLETSVLMTGGAAGGEGNEVTLQRISAGEVLGALRPLPPFFWGPSLGAESGWGAGVPFGPPVRVVQWVRGA